MYVLDNEAQLHILTELTLVESEDEGWLRRYTDDEGNEWTLYHPFPEVHGGGPPYLRRGQPPRNDEEVPAWVLSLLRSRREDDADGAATDLRRRHEVWESVLDRIEAEFDSLDSKLVEIFIEDLGIDPSNRRPILGKPFAEIKQDAAHFAALSRQASRLYQLAKNANK